MLEKLKLVSGSIRFWILVLIAIVQILGNEGVLTSELVKTLTYFLGVSIGVRTIDRGIDVFKNNKK